LKKLWESYEKFSLDLLNIFHSEKGQTLVEYGLLLVFIAVLLILMLRGTGLEVNNLWSKINSGITR
jgi:Flp pilus assembly pilin Flp